jgi:hypothetical protein
MEMGTTHHQTRWGGKNRRISGKMALSLAKWFFAHLLARRLYQTSVSQRRGKQLRNIWGMCA